MQRDVIIFDTETVPDAGAAKPSPSFTSSTNSLPPAATGFSIPILTGASQETKFGPQGV